MKHWREIGQKDIRLNQFSHKDIQCAIMLSLKIF